MALEGDGGEAGGAFDDLNFAEVRSAGEGGIHFEAGEVLAKVIDNGSGKKFMQAKESGASGDRGDDQGIFSGQGDDRKHVAELGVEGFANMLEDLGNGSAAGDGLKQLRFGSEEILNFVAGNRFVGAKWRAVV